MNIGGNSKIAGVFIKNIIPASPAERCNVLQVGDRILSVDETNLKDATHQYAVSVIKNAGLKIRLVVERFHKWVSVFLFLPIHCPRRQILNLLLVVYLHPLLHQQNDIFNVCDGDDKGVILDKCHPPPITPAKTPECIVVQVSGPGNCPLTI